MVQHTLPLVLSTRFIRFHPNRQLQRNCLRVEVYSSTGETVAITGPDLIFKRQFLSPVEHIYI